MFDPGQVRRLRKAVESDPDLESFDQFRVAKQILNLGGGLSSAAVPDEFGTVYPPDIILGAPVRPACLAGVVDCRFPLPVPQLTAVDGGRLIGFTSVLDSKGRLYTPDFMDSHELAIFRDENAAGYHGFVFHEMDDCFFVYFGTPVAPIRHDKAAFFIPNIEPGNYGSFLLRVLPQLSALACSKLEFDCYIVSERTPWIAEAIELFDLPRRPVFAVREVNGDYFRRIVFYNNLYSEGLLSKRLTDHISRCLLEKTSVENMEIERSENIYVSRSLSSLWRPGYRVMVNANEVESVAHDSGFSIVHPECLSLKTQLSLFSSARRIIGPSGSGMLNAMMAPAGARVVDIETDHFTVRQHAKVYSSTDKTYAFLFCEPVLGGGVAPHLASYNVNLDFFRDAVAWTRR